MMNLYGYLHMYTFQQVGSLSCYACCVTWPRVFGLTRWTAPFCCIERFTRSNEDLCYIKSLDLIKLNLSITDCYRYMINWWYTANLFNLKQINFSCTHVSVRRVLESDIDLHGCNVTWSFLEKWISAIQRDEIGSV